MSSGTCRHVHTVKFDCKPKTYRFLEVGMGSLGTIAEIFYFKSVWFILQKGCYFEKNLGA